MVSLKHTCMGLIKEGNKLIYVWVYIPRIEVQHVGLTLICGRRRWLRGSHRLWLVLKDLPGLLLVAQLLDAFPLQVARLALLKQGVGSPVPPQELGGCAGAEDWEKHTHTSSNSLGPSLQSHHLFRWHVFVFNKPEHGCVLLICDYYSNWSQQETDYPV